jgi:Fur family ferric uptake transcriptional regulator
MQRFRRYLLEKGLKYTRQRRAIALAFYRGNKHLSLPELLELAKQREKSIGYATVYRTMKLLAEGGLAVEHQFADGQTRYEPAEEGEHHDHIICVKCGRIVEFEDSVIESRQEAIAAREGFRVASHKLEIYGECLSEECEEGEGPAEDPHLP